MPVPETFIEFKSLERATIDLEPVVEEFQPDHFHWLFPVILKKHHPVLGSLLQDIHMLSLKIRGLEVKADLLRGAYRPIGRWPASEFLKQSMDDFKITEPFDIYINTTKIKGNLYQVNIAGFEMAYGMSGGEGSWDIPENQPLVKAMLAARV